MCDRLAYPRWTVGETIYHLARGDSGKYQNCSQATLDPRNDIGIHAISDHHRILGMGIDCAQGRTHHQWIRLTDVIGLDTGCCADQRRYGAGRRNDSSLARSPHIRISGNETCPIHHKSNGTRNAFNTIWGRLSKYHIAGLVVCQHIANIMQGCCQPCLPDDECAAAWMLIMEELRCRQRGGENCLWWHFQSHEG